MNVAFCDSSALVKLVVKEPESALLLQHLRGYSRVVASELAAVEVVRAVRRRAPGSVAMARRLLRSLDLVALDSTVIERAALLKPPELRTLDALQVASALRLSPLDPVFVAYDLRATRAATHAGLRTSAPGEHSEQGLG